MSKVLINRIKGKSCGKGSGKTGLTPDGLIDRGGHWTKDFAPKQPEEEQEKDKTADE